MYAPDDPLLDCFGEHGVRDYLRSLAHDDLLLTDAETLPELEALPDDATSCRIVHVDTVDAEATAAAGSIVVWTAEHERERVRALRREHPAAEVFGLVAHVLPRLAAQRPPHSAARPAENGYVILCTPRSGSYHLCGLLAGLGFGTPDEHLDQGLCAAAPRARLPLRLYLDTLLGTAVAHGWFGTKLISHVLFAAFDAGLPAADFLAWLQHHGLRVLHLVREDKVAQAVSNYFARRTGVWNASAEQPVPARPPYDFAEILSDWRELRQQEQWLEQLVAHLPSPPHRIVYEQLDGDPERVVRGVVSHLTDGGDAPLPFCLRPRTRKLRDGVSAEYARRFAADLQAHGDRTT
jgi:LPS sulfotransferase NodH